MYTKLLPLLLAIVSTSFLLNAQNPSIRSTMAILNIDTENLDMTPEQMGNLTRLEMDKLGIYEVMDRYDVAYMIQKNGINIEHCYGKICITEVGNQLGVEKMLTGSVEHLGEAIIINFRLIDVQNQSVEKSKVNEFLFLPQQLQLMIRITIQQLLGQEVEQDILNKLTQQFEYENALNNPDTDRLKLDGPRSGLTIYSGETARIYQLPENEGGFNGIPVLFQFGYQFEVAYLNQGNFQALFEFIPIITGLDQGRAIPSISILNGLRSNRTGWEFAFGPIFYLTTEARGYFDEENNWHLESDWWQENPNGPYEIPYPVVERLDSRGNARLGTGFLFGIGKTFKSGRLNIPVNAFLIPDQSGSRFGVSVGFNATKKKKDKKKKK